MTTETTQTTEARALAAWRAKIERDQAEAHAREEAERATLSAALAAEAAAAIEAHGWLFNVAGATYDADAGVIRTGDGLAFHHYKRHPRGATAPEYEITLAWSCDDCGEPTEALEGGYYSAIRTLEDLGSALDSRAAAGPNLCRVCNERQYEAWLKTEDDAAPKGPEIRPARDGWVYLPARQQWINGAAIESVSSDASGESDALYITYLPINPATDNDEYVRDEHDVRALTRWLEDWS